MSVSVCVCAGHEAGDCYLCVICDVQSDILAVADVAVLDGRTRPLAADAHS